MKQFVLYRDETVSYYFQEIKGKERHVTKTRKVGPPHRASSGKYSRLNEMVKMMPARRKQAMIRFQEEETAARQIFRKY